MGKVHIYIIILLSVGLSTISAQLCDGNLGDNIFTDGNFGSGAANIPSVDPGIAPGYTYITSPPPTDGSYTITNDITPWNFNWGWADIQDNSNDPDGYMMVVNASYEPGLFYEKQIDGLCENTLYEFSVDVHNLHTGANLIKPNVSFLLNDIVQITTGNVPENNKWNSYGFTFTTAVGETSVKLSLANNAPGGNGNDLAIDNISFRACGPEALILPLAVENICEDGNAITLDATVNGEQFGNPAYQWQQSFDGGITWLDLPGEIGPIYLFDQLTAGTYYYRYKIASDESNLSNTFCQIISNIKIVEVIPKFTSFAESFCEGFSIQVGDNIYNETGNYVDTLQNSLGCDSIVTLELSVLPDMNISAQFEDTEPQCSYSLDGSLLISNVINTYEPHTIFLNGIQTDNLIPNLAAGNYDIKIIDDLGCELDTFAIVNSPEEFVINLGADVQIELGDELNLTLEHNYDLVNTIYQSIYGVDCPGVCTDITLTPFTDGEIIVQSISTEDCIARDTISVRIVRNIKIYAPNTFSPNGDNINETFTIFPQPKSFKSIAQFSIFDRWGNKVFSIKNVESGSQNISWDGTLNGIPVSQGVYSYFAEVEFIDSSTEIISGTVTLTR